MCLYVRRSKVMFLSWRRAATKSVQLKKAMLQRPRRGRVRWCRPLLETLENRLAPSVTLTLPTSGVVTDGEGSIAMFPININQLTDNSGRVGLGSFNLAVTYPTNVFRYSDMANGGGNVTEGSVLQSGGIWSINVQAPEDGQLNIQVTAQGPINSDNPPAGGSLVI